MKYENKVLTIDNNKYLVIKTIEIENSTFALLNNNDDESDSSFVEIYEENGKTAIRAIDSDYFQEKVFPQFMEI